MDALEAPVQGVSFYVEKINIASKLRAILEMALESAIFRQIVPSHVQTPSHQISYLQEPPTLEGANPLIYQLLSIFKSNTIQTGESSLYGVVCNIQLYYSSTIHIVILRLHACEIVKNKR